MSDTSAASSELRAVNARIAAAYDLMPFDSEAIPGIDPARAFGVGALYGAAPTTGSFDVLDLGCGTGVQMARMGDLTKGRVVGVDLSASACAAARTRCARLGARAEVICGDLLDLEASRLGTFDLIYAVGVLYVIPPDVQRHVLRLIARCLKPGGVALLSYYAGTAPLLMSGLAPVLRLAVDAAASPADQIRKARVRLGETMNMLARQGGDHRAVLSVLQQVQSRPDAVFFHEMLGQHFTALTTSALEAGLGADGVHFLNALSPYPAPLVATPQERAMLADTADFAGGSYRYTIFAKCAGAGTPNMREPRVRWVSTLQPVSPGVFRTPQGGSITINSSGTAAALEILALGPAAWPAMSTATNERLPGTDTDKTLEQDLIRFWQHGLLLPEWHPA